MNCRHFLILLSLLLFPILALNAYSISGLCVNTDTGQVMVGGWGPAGFPGGFLTWSFSGVYTAQVPSGWSGIITPHSSIPGTFFPPNRTYEYVISDFYDQNYVFTPITFSISGRVTRADNGQGMPGVTFNNLSGNPESDAYGYYSGNVVSGWSGTVTPHHTFQGNFSPPSRSYSNVLTNQINQNYTFDMNVVSISGTVTNIDSGQPLSGVTLLDLPGNPQTDSLGYYYSIVPQGFTEGVRPYFPTPGVFTPAYRVYINVSQNFTNQNYTWSALTYTISGRVISDETGLGIEGVTFTGFEQSPVTNQYGMYSATVNWGFSSTVMPVHSQGGSFNPAHRIYNNLTANSLNQNYQWSSTPIIDEIQPITKFSIYPNPFQYQVTISCQLDRAIPFCMDIYDLKGRLIKRLSESTFAVAKQTYTWDGTDNSQNSCPNGIYICRISAGTYVQSRKLALLR